MNVSEISTASVFRAGAASASGRLGTSGDATLAGPTWFAVADGIGGRPAGRQASRAVIAELSVAPPVRSVDEIAPLVAAINTRVRQAGAAGGGSTLVAATALAHGVAVVHVGDSRCYRLHDGELTLITRDHSVVQELVDLGRIPVERAASHRLRHVVTRAIGIDADVRADVAVLPQPVGRLLLCSDGLTDRVPPRSIGRVLAAVADPDLAARRLVELAGAAADDVSAVVVDLAAPSSVL